MITRVLVTALVVIAGVLVTGAASSPPAWIGATLVVAAVAWFSRDRANRTPPKLVPAPSRGRGVRVWFRPQASGPVGEHVVEVGDLVVRARVETRNWLLTPPPSVSRRSDHVAPSKHRVVLDMTWTGTEAAEVWIRPHVLERQPPATGDVVLTDDTMQLKPEIEVLLDAEPACLRLVRQDRTATGIQIPIAAGGNRRLVLAAVTDRDDVRWQLQFTPDGDDPTTVRAFELRTTAATGWAKFMPDGTVLRNNPNDYHREYTARLGDGITDPPA
ncbi:hypothetical protein [Lentzea sp. HUAS12]|uniref:hypothetical protein n=1 Tax=Lentzea sp. HUAS12 TaxID=2951806 RepID=UPI00209E675F|nr:hypothetical protein [Lentzea sp. HUAS12]USX55564.1 hypothetical protein ND450_16110 [Lentzea sp. HUAS12]